VEEMEWMNHGGRPTQGTQAATQMPASTQQIANKKRGCFPAMKMASVGLLYLVTILILVLVSYLVFGGNKTQSQGKFADTTKMQAVFLNGGQVYFGNIKTLNNQYLRLNNIYYLKVNQTVQPNGQTTTGDVSLVKLGCELHGPEDSMVINQSQVIFWENLKTDGQVAKAVADYVKQNPNGQQCNTSNGSSNSSSTNSSTTPASTTSTTTTTKKN
jgi:hypothetical protein